MEKYTLGLDIGIASVGWAVVNSQSEEIVESGVRLFDSADASKNQERRAFRGIKRNSRRRRHRLDRLNDFFNKHQFIKPLNINLSPVELRAKGLEEKLTKEELYAALYNIAKHRGVSYLEDLEETKDNNAIIEAVANSSFDFPCQIQKNRYEKYGFFRGTHTIEDESFINTFTIGMYEKEARKILDTQSKFHPIITPEFTESYIGILKSKREYYIGPGNKLSRTNYGVYKTSGEIKDNLFDELRGKCSVYNGKNGMDAELRASGASYTAQYYNLLNDLCNIKIDGEKLSRIQKEEVLDLIKNNNNAMKITAALKKLYKTDPSIVSGYRIDRDDKEENHSFEAYRGMRKFLSEKNIEISKFSSETLDAISDILTLNTETQGMYNYFNNSERPEHQFIKDLTELEIEAFIDFRRKKGTLFNKWSSFSYRLLKQVIPEMEESGDEQQTCINRMKIRKYDATSETTINHTSIVEEIYNPVVVRAVSQSIKIVNTLLKRYSFSDIVIEMARDRNEDEARKNIKKMQSLNEKSKKEAITYVGVPEAKLDFRNHNKLLLKLKLLYKQQGKCLYSGNPIDIDKLLSNENYYEIDHIIPISISFDDSQSNKVLVEASQNRKKGNSTPFSYLSKSTDSWNYDEYKAYVLNLYNGKFINKKQKELLLFEEDITKESVVQNFINRNINDTRYASRVVLNELQRFFKNNSLDTKIKVINGSMTNQIRIATLKYDKDRDLDYRHHAEDAAICCFAIMSLKKYGNEFVNLETGEIIERDKFYSLGKDNKAEYLSLSGWDARKKLLQSRAHIKFSHKVDRKINRGISDQTIYSTRTVDESTYVVSKLSDIYNNKDAKKKIIEKENDFLMYKHDPKTWEQLKKIIEMYPEETNPFKKYKDEFGPIRKYSKKGSGPEIKDLKYLNNKMGSHIDISHNYKDSKNKVILMSLKPYRSDIYFDKNKNCFNVVPIKYNDFKFEKGEYILPVNNYIVLLKNEGLLNENQTFADLENNGHEFKFSLYKNDILEIGDENHTSFYRFLAKNHNAKNCFEVKGVDKKLEKQTHITAKKQSTVFYKYNVDILGNMHRIIKEDLKLKFSLDNKMI